MSGSISDNGGYINYSFEKLEIIRKLNGKIKDAFDVAFGNNVADTIFKYVSPHGIVAGNQYYSFYILDYLMPKIGEVTGETSKATNDALAKAMQKHGVKYQHKFNR